MDWRLNSKLIIVNGTTQLKRIRFCDVPANSLLYILYALYVKKQLCIQSNGDGKSYLIICEERAMPITNFYKILTDKVTFFTLKKM